MTRFTASNGQLAFQRLHDMLWSTFLACARPFVIAGATIARRHSGKTRIFNAREVQRRHAVDRCVSGLIDVSINARSRFAWSENVARPIIGAIVFAAMLVPATSFAESAQELQKVATTGLNEFDLASYCYGLEYHYQPVSGVAPKPHSLFGYATVSSGAAAEFVYITSRYFVQKGPYGDPQGCEFRRSLYRLDKGGFRRVELDEGAFAQLEQSIRVNARNGEHSHSDKRLTGAGASKADSVGDCLFPIEWRTIGGQDYALLSIVVDGAVVDYVTPHYERALSGRPSTCAAWGERHLTNSSIVSSGIGFLAVDADRLFVESMRYQTGFLFKSGLGFQCVEGSDAFSRHILIRRDVFDAEVRPGLEEILDKNEYKSKVATSGGEQKILSFQESVFLNQEFAAFANALTAEKGCN